MTSRIRGEHSARRSILQSSARAPRGGRFGQRGALLIGVMSCATMLTATAFAQPAPRPQPAAPAAPAARPGQAPLPNPAAPAGAAQPTAGQPGAGDLGPGEPDDEKVDPLATALAPQPGGLTPEMVAHQAALTSPAVRGKRADLASAEGQTEQAAVTLAPRLTLSASYTRLSTVTQAGLGGAIVGAKTPGLITVGPCAANPAAQCLFDAAGGPVGASNFSFPSLVNQTVFQANLVVPISDYFFRSVTAYQAAEHNEDALKLQVQAQDLQTSADAKVIYLQWIQAKGQTVVAHQAVEQSQKQLADAKTGIAVGTASQADLMRIEARLAQSQFEEADAASVEAGAEQRLRTTMHLTPDKRLTIGIDVLSAPVQPRNENVDALIAEAAKNRLDIQAFQEQRVALSKAASATKGGYAPRLETFADATIADPNQRIFPQQDKFNGTWDVGVRLTWVVNDTFSNIGAVKQANARVAQVDAQKDALVDAMRVEVTNAHADLTKSAPSLEAAERGVKAAQETLRVTRKLFAFGKATGLQIVDAETDLESARLRALSAHVNLIAAQIRLDHAVGRDRGRNTGR